MGRKINTEQDVAEKISTVLQNKRKRHARRRLLGRSFKFVSIISFVILTFVVIYRYKDEMSIDKLNRAFGDGRIRRFIPPNSHRIPLPGMRCWGGLAVATEKCAICSRHGDGFRLDVTLKKPNNGRWAGGLAFDGGGSQLFPPHQAFWGKARPAGRY